MIKLYQMCIYRVVIHNLRGAYYDQCNQEETEKFVFISSIYSPKSNKPEYY